MDWAAWTRSVESFLGSGRERTVLGRRGVAMSISLAAAVNQSEKNVEYRIDVYWRSQKIEIKSTMSGAGSLIKWARR